MPEIPKRLPPVFMAWAEDDPLTLKFQVRMRDALVAAGHKPEVHVFPSGGHGFGMKTQQKASDGWIELFHNWLAAQGLVARDPAKRP
jgi:acetyl esterase/lipase